MKIHTFKIERFGSFEEQLLDLSTGSSDFHIVYGPNEAGKSTMLRAIVNLLYGIPAQTTDAFLYSYEDMRLTATLGKMDGGMATFIRRKGNKATLLDANQQPIDEGILASFLCGITMNAFTTMFGFDYQLLLKGRQDLKEGKGDLAESLFQAGMGITGLRGVLEGLQREKDGVFSPRSNASTPVMNSALRQYKEAMKNVGDLAVRPKEWHKLADEIKSIEADFEDVRKTYDKHLAEKTRFERFQKAFPFASQRGVIHQSLSDLPTEQILTESQVERYRSANERLLNAAAERDRITKQKCEIEARWSDAGLIGRLIRHKDEIASLQSRLLQYESARKDLPKVAGEQTRHESDAKGILQDMGVEQALHGPPFLCIGVIQRTAIAEFAMKHFGAEMPRTKVLSSQAKDPSGLKRHIEAAADEGRIEQTALEACKKLAALKEEADNALRSLTLWQGTLEKLAELPVPLDQTVSRFEREFSGIDSSIRDIERDMQSHESDLEANEEKISVLEGTRPVPTENELTQDRERRQQGWALVRRGWLDGEPVVAELAHFDPDHSLEQAYEISVDKADDTADRLRFEADRVASLAELKAGVAKAESKLEGLGVDLQNLRSQHQEKDAQWTELWAPVEISEPLSPAEMREWLRRHERLVQFCKDIRDKETKLAEIQEAITSHRTQILEELASVGVSVIPDDTTLQYLISLSRDLIESAVRLKELALKVEQGNDALSRVQQMENSVATFSSDVAQMLAQTQMTELACREAGEAAKGIQEKFEQAAKDHAGLDLLESQINDASDAQNTAENDLIALAGEVACVDLQALETAVVDSEEYYQLKTRQKELDEMLAAHSAGASVEDLIAEISEISEDELPALIAGLARELQGLDARRDELSDLRGNKRRELGDLDHSGELAEEVQKAQSALAEARSAVERYVPLHLAAEILGMEIERYQKENQDPVLSRASEIFPQLTLGSFEKVATQHTTKGNQVIVGVRPSGTQVDVGGMSDGTRDQLYLALRIASLEQHLKGGVLLPLIVDDVLIEFDDERACAALEALAQLSQKTQVLYFTHHRHIVELAGNSVGTDRVSMHELATFART